MKVWICSCENEFGTRNLGVGSTRYLALRYAAENRAQRRKRGYRWEHDSFDTNHFYGTFTRTMRMSLYTIYAVTEIELDRPANID